MASLVLVFLVRRRISDSEEQFYFQAHKHDIQVFLQRGMMS